MARSDEKVPPVVFSVETDMRQYDIGLATDAGSRLLTDDKLSYGAAWSPDGVQIAFVRDAPNTWEECCGYAEERLWVMDADGGDAEPVSGVLDDVSPPQWTPDGDALVFTDDGPKGVTLYHLDLGAGEDTAVLDGFGNRDFSLSPDGTQLVSGNVEPRQIVIVDLDDGSQQVVANDVFGYGKDVRWSPDGDWLVMSALVRGVDDGGTWAWNLKTEELVEVSASQRTTYTWSSGNQLLICRQIPDPALKDEFFTDRGELWLIDVADGGKGRRVTGYDESLDPQNPPGDCIGAGMDARVVSRDQ
ncbi:MAG TPA: hypothetical protein VMX11_08790 [Actinomycetes bacterium]|nr:hypothetical protein [Actinomycetes bacterium]